MVATEQALTGLSLKEFNRRHLVKALREHGALTKNQLVKVTGLSLSTVDSNVKTLLKEGLLITGDFQESTGGRKARRLEFNAQYRLSVGLGILREAVHVVIGDLSGKVCCQEEWPLTFTNTEGYFEALGKAFEDLLSRQGLTRSVLLPPFAAVQGLVDKEGTRVLFSPLMDDAQGLDSERLSKALSLPVTLCHDSTAAGFYELWRHPELNLGALFLLNRNFGGALFYAGRILEGLQGTAGTLEHYCVNPEGERCYCGARGCLETYCSANALRARSGLTVHEFFKRLREDDRKAAAIWQEYLSVLASVARNVLSVLDGTLLLSGYLTPFMTEADLGTLLQLINDNYPFKIGRERIVLTAGGDAAPALGAAICSTRSYLDREGLR